MTKGEETKRFITERSAVIFNTKGIAATSMNDIMEATNLSKGSLYVHFENKDVLACAAVDYNMDMLALKVQSAIKKYKTAKDRLFAYLDVFKDPMNSPVFGGCPMINFGMEADDTNAIVREKVNRMIEISQQLVKEIIQRGIKDGEFKAKWDYEEFATITFAMIEGGIMMCRVAGNNDKMKIIIKNIKKRVSKKVK
ncbi:MAG: yxaF 2 [Mucilaginibacter sp.]|nr:yxaF 2 [Mucilaginibacter sp.]